MGCAHILLEGTTRFMVSMKAFSSPLRYVSDCFTFPQVPNSAIMETTVDWDLPTKDMFTGAKRADFFEELKKHELQKN